MRTVIYARFSSKLQNDRSIEDQISMCRERAEREDWTIVEVFTDYAIGGGKGIEGQRPGIAALLASVEAGGVDQVLTESTDRLARHQGDDYAIREIIEHAGARLFTLMEGVVDDITGTFKGLMNARFRKDLAVRIKRGQRGMVQQGRAPAGIAFGYRRANRLDERGDLVRGLREIDTDQAAIVVRIFTEYAAGISPQQIAERLNAEGVPGPRGHGWAESTIRGDVKRGNGILRNRLYAGELVVSRNSKVVEPRSRSTRIRPNPQEQWVTHPVPDLRIVEAHLWQAVQDRLDETRGVPIHVQRRPKHMLSGLGRCGVCGGGWIRVGRDYWGCGRSKDGGRCTNKRTLSTVTFEQRVLEQLGTHLLDPELVAAYVREYHREYARRTADLGRDRAQLDRKLAEAKRRIERFVAAIGEGMGDIAEIREGLARARAERERAQAAIDHAEALPVMALHPTIADQYRRQVASLGEALSGNEATRLEAIPKLRELIDAITITPAPSLRGSIVTVEGRLNAILRLAGAPDLQQEPNRRAYTG